MVEGMVIDPATQPFAEFNCVGQGLALQWAMPALTRRPQKITFGEMRSSGVRGVLVYCQNYQCSHSTKDQR
jgi:hypothetical protein